jgi:ribosome-associated toxin RatA of RatAB toxin-antitoxin module
MLLLIAPRGLVSQRHSLAAERKFGFEITENTQVAIKLNLNFRFRVFLCSTLIGEVVKITSKIYITTFSCETLLKFIMSLVA